MKKYSTLLILFLPLCLCAQQKRVQGVVTYHNSAYDRGKTVGIAQALVRSSDGKDSAFSDASGAFTLLLSESSGKQPLLLSVSKEGLEVVNIESLEVLPDQTEPLHITMASSRYLYEARMHLYNRSFACIQAHAAQKAEALDPEDPIRTDLRYLDNLRAQRQRQQPQYYRQLAYQKTVSRDFAEKYALMRLDEGSALFQGAFRFVEENEPDAALEYVSGNSWDPSNIDALRLKADLHQLAFEVDSAQSCYLRLLKIAPEDLSNLRDYAAFLIQTEQYPAAIPLYRRAAELSLRQSEKVIFLEQLGSLYERRRQADSALWYREEVARVAMQLAEQQPSAWADSAAQAWLLLSDAYSKAGRQEQAIRAWEQARKLMRVSPNTGPGYNTRPVNSLSSLLHQLESEADFKEKVRIQEEIITLILPVYDRQPKPYLVFVCRYPVSIYEQRIILPSEMNPLMSELYSNLSYYCLFSGDYERAEQAANVSLSYDPSLRGYLNLGHSYLLRDDVKGAKKAYLPVKKAAAKEAAAKKVQAKQMLQHDLLAFDMEGIRPAKVMARGYTPC